MARARNIKPSFFSNDVLAEINPYTRLLFIGLWCIADRKGRLEDRPKKIKAEVLPYDECDVDEMLTQLHDRNFIIRYEVNGLKVIQVINFDKHQAPHRNEKDSELPEYSGAITVQGQKDSGATSDQGQKDSEKCTVGLALIDDCGLMIPDSGLRNDESGPRTVQPPHETRAGFGFQMFWDCYPRHRQANKSAAAALWPAAIAAVAEDRKLPGDSAEQWLIDRGKKFSRSRLGRSKYCPGCDKWLERAKYFDADEAWAEDKEEAWT